MYEFIHGTLVEKQPTFAIVETGGIGYKLWITVQTFSSLPFEQKKVLLYTSFIVREESQTLYGFLSKEEKTVFELLLTISGIGPKSALALIGHLSISSLELAIQTNNSKLIAKAPGIGKKTAERLIIDLKDKFQKITFNDQSKQPSYDLMSDAINALMNLGYNPQVAQKTVKQSLDENDAISDLGELITAALKRI